MNRFSSIFGIIIGAIACFTLISSAHAERIVGVGVQIRINSSFQTEVIGVLPSSPAALAGLLPGDLILSVDGRLTRGQSLEVVTAWLRGPGFVGSPVTLEMYLPRIGVVRVVQLFRQVIGQDCALEGQYRLRLSGSPDSGWLYGNIGNQSVDWRVAFGRISARVGGRFNTLELQSIPYSNEFEVIGWIGATRINWRSFAGILSGYQPCISP